MADDWSDLEAVMPEFAAAYNGWVKAQQEERATGKKWLKAQQRWLDAHEARRQVLLSHWDEEKDGFIDEQGYVDDHRPSLGRVLQRYYAEKEVKHEGKARKGAGRR